MKRAINIFFILPFLFLFLSIIFNIRDYPGATFFLLLGFLGLLIFFLSRSLKRIVELKAIDSNSLFDLLLSLMAFVLGSKYSLWYFADIAALLIVPIFIGLILYFVFIKKVFFEFPLKPRLAGIVFFILTIPLFVSVKEVPRQFLLPEWLPENKDDSDKRNSNWVWSVDEQGQEGKWIPVGNKTNVQNGFITAFYDNGNTYSKTKILQNKRIDTTWYYDFKISDRLIKIHVDKAGNESWYFPNNGPFAQFYQNGKPHSKGYVSKNTFGYFWVNYSETGIIKFREYRDTLTNLRSYSNYYPNGKISDTATTINGLAEGESIIWYENGKIDEYNSWKNGKQHGESKLFYQNGQIKNLYYSNNGKPDSISIGYYDSGVLEYINLFEDGKPHGILKKYFWNGRLKIETEFKKGIQEGSMVQYSETGNVYFNGQLINGKMSGTWYYSTGEIFGICKYIGNQNQAEITYYTKSNRPFVLEILVDNRIVNIDTLYDFNLTKEELTRFENRRKN